MARTTNIGGLQCEVKITDEVSPVLLYAQVAMNPAIEAGLRAAGNEIKKGVQKKFREAQSKYPNKDMTRAMKGGKSALEDTGRLKSSIMDKSGVDVKRTQTGYVLSVSWDLPASSGSPQFPGHRKEGNYIYLLVQEHGSTNMKKLARITRSGKKSVYDKMWELKARPFFNDGVQEGLERSTAVANAIIGNVVDLERLSGSLKYEGLGVRMTPTMMPRTPLSTLMYITPPTKMLMYVGAASDFAGAWRGSFTEVTILGYMRQMFWGQMGVTQKSTRRGIRRSVWG